MATKTTCLLILPTLLSVINFVYGFLDIDELQSVHYGIDILQKPVVIGKDESPGAVYLQSKFGQQYQCSFPDHSQQERLKEAEEKLAIEIGIPELLRPLETGPCLIKIKDWWTYEFCYGKHIRQYHQEEGKISGEISYLGLFQSEFDWTEDETSKQKNHLNRYHSQQYGNGSKCDLTQEPRRTEVRFVCEEGSGDYISRIDEPETCVYILTVHTTKICHHPNVKPKAHSHNVPILCNPVISDTQYEQYLIELEEERLFMKNQAVAVQSEDESLSEDGEIEETTKHKLFADPDEPKNPRAELHELLNKLLMKKEGQVTGETPLLETEGDVPTMMKDAPETADTLDTLDTDSSQSEDVTGMDQEDEDYIDQTTANGNTDHVDQTTGIGNTDDLDQTTDIGNTDHQPEGGLGQDMDYVDTDLPEVTNAMKRLKSVLQSQLDNVFKEADDIDEESDDDIAEEAETDSDQNSEQGGTANDQNSQEGGIAISKKNPAVGKLIDRISERQTAKEVGELAEVEESDRVKVRVTRLKGQNSKVDDPDNPSPQTHLVETTIQDELQKAGLDTEGGKIRVKIVTSGFSDSEESTVHVLSEEDSAAFNKMIVAILGGNQEAAKEAARHADLEENYSLVWDKHRPQRTKTP